jgi:hypothetical protein
MIPWEAISDVAHEAALFLGPLLGLLLGHRLAVR